MLQKLGVYHGVRLNYKLKEIIKNKYNLIYSEQTNSY